MESTKYKYRISAVEARSRHTREALFRFDDLAYSYALQREFELELRRRERVPGRCREEFQLLARVGAAMQRRREWLMRKIQSTAKASARVEDTPRVAAAECEEGSELLALQAELSALVQHVYEMAVVHLQRCWRGIMGRRRHAELLHVHVVVALHTATLQIQRRWRGIAGRRRFQRCKEERERAAATVVQSWMRRWLAARNVERIKLNLLQEGRWACAVVMQSLVRGFLARRRVRAMTTAPPPPEVDNHRWAVMCIQRFARGYLVRSRRLKELRTQQKLSRRVLHLAEKYLANGDLWGFLDEVDADYKFYDQQITDHNHSENTSVSMYVDKVIKERQTLFDNSWTSFQQATSNTKHKSLRSPAQRAAGHQMPPGAMLRRVYGVTVHEKPTRKRPRPKRDTSANAPIVAVPHVPNVPMPSRRTASPGDLNSGLDIDAEAADSVLRDLPGGVNESVDKLLKVAVLRVFVPPQMGDSTPEEAFAVYQSLPVCLAKVRHQQQAYGYVAKSIALLNSRGYRFVADLIPVSKIPTAFEELGVPKDVTQRCKDIVTLLKRIADRSTKNDISSKYEAVQAANQFSVPQQQQAGTSSEAASEASKWLSRVTTAYSKWGDLEDDLDSLVVHASFFVHGHPQLVLAAESQSLQCELRHFALTLMSSTSEDARQDMIRTRFRDAMLMATPLTLAMKADGVTTIRELMESDLSKWEMPRVLRLEIERMLQLITASKFGRTRNATNPLQLFDSRYQRSATDPSGRPPRLAAPSTQQKQLSDQQARVQPVDGSIDPELPVAASWSADIAAGGLILQSEVATTNAQTTFPTIHSPKDLEAFKNGLWRTSSTPRQHPHRTDTQTQPEPTTTKSRLRNSKLPRSSRFAQTSLPSSDRSLKPFRKTRMAPWAPYVTDINTFRCDHPSCRMSFGRMYLLQMHKRSHDTSPNYYQYRSAPQIGLDLPDPEVVADSTDPFPSDFGSDLPDHVLADLASIRERLRSRGAS